MFVKESADETKNSSDSDGRLSPAMCESMHAYIAQPFGIRTHRFFVSATKPLRIIRITSILK